MSSSLRHWMAEGRAASALDVQGAMEARTTLYRHVERWFERFDLVATPTLARPAVPIDTDPLGSVEIEGIEAGGLRDGWYPYTHPFNLTGHPAITLPAGFVAASSSAATQGPEGGQPGTGPGAVELPVGLQLVGPWLADAEVLGAAAVFEQLRPWAERWPPLGP
jgi:aspartyl-tRNA(Asn)/glutamyl-tRNA(Gln) amidotransferase subunit A